MGDAGGGGAGAGGGAPRVSEAEADEIVARSLRGENAPCVAAATGRSVSTVRNVLRRCGARKMDRPDAVDPRRKPSPDVISPDWRHPSSALTEGEWDALFARWHLGERPADLCAEAGVTLAAFVWQARQRGCGCATWRAGRRGGGDRGSRRERRGGRSGWTWRTGRGRWRR